MAQLRQNKMCLFVILLLQFKAITGQKPLAFTVREGEEVTLPCENVIKNQLKCDSTSWMFSYYAGGKSEELVAPGQISKDGIPKPKADRLSLTEKCSLVIKNVGEDDVGRYTCRQNKSGEQQGPDALVYLSVVFITEQQANNRVNLYCGVVSYGGCKHTVKWVITGEVNNVDTSLPSCSDELAIRTYNHNPDPYYYEFLKCNVTDNKSGQVLLCGVGPGPSCVKPGNTSTGDPTIQGLLRLIIVSVGLATLIIIVVAVNIWTRTGKKTEMDDNAVHYDRG